MFFGLVDGLNYDGKIHKEKQKKNERTSCITEEEDYTSLAGEAVSIYIMTSPPPPKKTTAFGMVVKR
jgi:hypothetical protein